MKELELTSNAALTDAVYETALNGSFLEVKLVAGSVGDDEPRGMQPEYEMLSHQLSGQKRHNFVRATFGCCR